MSSEQRIRLLEHIAYDQFGPAPGEITSILLARSSLTLDQLVRLSSLPKVVVQQALLVLSLHSCIYHTRPLMEGQVEVYEINEVELERRMRGARYSEMALRSGKAYAAAVELCWVEGMVKPQEMADEILNQGVDLRTKAEREDETDAMLEDLQEAKGKKSKGKKRAREVMEYDAESRAMLQVELAQTKGLIIIVTPDSRNSPLGLEMKWESQLSTRHTGIMTTKEAKTLKEKLDEHRIEQRALELEYEKGKVRESNLVLEPTRKVKVRKAQGDVSAASTSTVTSDGYTFSLDAWYRINAERFHIRWRNELIIEFCEARLNSEAAIVLETLLNIVEPGVKTMLEEESRTVGSNELHRALKKGTMPSLGRGLSKRSRDPSWSHETAQHPDVYCAILACADDLAIDQSGSFLKIVSSGGGMSNVRIQFGKIAKRMQRSLVEAMIEQQHSLTAIRCWRILETKGKLDEKHLARLAFLSVKEAREMISRLAAASLIEPQEVPRSADRAPSRTFYLWFVNYDKVVEALLNHHYKALGNIQAQKRYQLDLKSAVVAKRNRPEVRANPEECLTTSERYQLAQLDKVIEALTVGEMRLDKDVFVLRDMNMIP